MISDPERELRVGHWHTALVDVQFLEATALVDDRPVGAAQAEPLAHDFGEQAVHQRAALRRRFLELHGIAETPHP